MAAVRCVAELLILLSFGAACIHCTGARTISAVRIGPWKYQIVEGLSDDAVVVASFNNTIDQTGWSFLEIRDTRKDVGKENTSDEEIAYLAGKMEGILTASLMEMQWENTMKTYCTDNSQLCKKITEFLMENHEYATVKDDTSTDPRWYQVKLFNQQITGLADGYSEVGQGVLPEYSYSFFQIYGELDDLAAALDGGNSSSQFHHVTGSGSCSALIKLLPGNADLLIGHNTWTSFVNMIRIFKLYDLKFRTSSKDHTVIPGHAQAFSSYPGRLFSGDDFYLISSGLVAMETSIENANPALWKYITPKCVTENVRVVVSNRLATSGKEWADYFKQDNSGTYNNQWMIADQKCFEKGKEPKAGLLWVLEQMPGYIHSEDQTDVLTKNSYWASYNIPFYEDIFKMSGNMDLVKKYGDWFSWDGAPRAKIFARDHSKVKDIPSLIELMEYNDFQHDPLAACNCTPPFSGENGIAARSDLNPPDGTYPFSALGHRLHGAIDMKVTSSELFQDQLSCHASSGPTHAQQPPFQWTTSGNKAGIPLGHPEKWNFDPVLINWNIKP